MILPTNDGTTSSDAATRAAKAWLEYMAKRPCVFIHHPSHAIRSDPQASGYDAYCQRQDWQEAMERVTPPINDPNNYLSEGHSAHEMPF